MKCEEIDIECFYTPLEKIKDKIDPVISKIDWTELSKQIMLHESILEYYKDRLNWHVIGNRLARGSIDLFSKYAESKDIDVSGVSVVPNDGILIKYFKELPVEVLLFNYVENKNIMKVVRMMVNDDRFNNYDIAKQVIHNRVISRHFRKEATLLLLNEIDTAFWNIVEQGDYIDNFNYWFDEYVIRDGYDNSNEKHRKAILEGLSKKGFERYQEMFSFSTKELINSGKLRGLNILVYAVTGKYKS